MSAIAKEAIVNVVSVSQVRYPARYKVLWLVAARLCVLSFPEKTFIIDDVREWSEKHGLPPSPSNRVWGSITRALKFGGHIRETGNKRRVTHVSTSSQKVKEWECIL